ncbi:hypothetical protein PG999_007905 [Apiospora kogelbergensis]|uniref:Uncharacterized protein n=1 Tax=Apiospora kogelbergensis TaxID=1337665 RepID=A0AAW0QP23_9PEZI
MAVDGVSDATCTLETGNQRDVQNKKPGFAVQYNTHLCPKSRVIEPARRRSLLLLQEKRNTKKKQEKDSQKK